MKTYPQQHEPWRPDYPPVWNDCCESYVDDFFEKPRGFDLVNRNISAFTTSVKAIVKAMKP